MSATLFLSPPLPPSNTHHFPYHSNPISHSTSISLSLTHNSLKTLKPIPPSNNNNNNNSSVKSTNPDSSISQESISRDGSCIRMPTAPWMQGPLLLEPNQVLDLSKQRNMKKNSNNGGPKKPDGSLTDKVSGGRGKKSMRKIFQGIGKLDETQNSEKKQERIELGSTLTDGTFKFGGKLTEEGDTMVFEKTEEGNSGEIEKNLESIGIDFSMGEIGGERNWKVGRKMPWERDERMIFRRMKKEKVASAAELILDEVLLERLRNEAKRMRKWVKVMKAGVTQAVVDQIHLVWKNNELAMLKFDMPLCRNMHRAREIVEIKTGGIVVWSRKDVLVIYRASNYEFGLKSYSKMYHGLAVDVKNSSKIIHQESVNISLAQSNESTADEMVGRMDGEKGSIQINGSLYEREADRLLDGLGPRFVDWWRPKPLPVDADLLPEVVPGFKTPFRQCPPRVRSKLTDAELTYLRKLTHPLPTHFVLGRNRKLQGLAEAILKLWEKSHIVKIAVKWGIPNTDNEQMANELKHLTGGVLLLRNKFFIILYRGKDFLPCRVANLVVDRELELQRCQFEEEAARIKAVEPPLKTSTIGTLSEFLDIQSECGDLKNGNREVEVQLEAEKQRLEKELRNQERKLFILEKKIERSGKELAKFNSALGTAELDEDQEIITEEERECFRKIGLKLDSSLVLGRRGVFDGVIEGLHQHWKHREIVKVITMQRMFSQVIYTAKLLGARSGGILVSVDKLKEGHAIIIYRGKNYRRPVKLVSRNLLNKREALFRSLEMQRIGSLKFFAYQRQQAISELKHKLAELEKRKRKSINTDLTSLQNMS